MIKAAGKRLIVWVVPEEEKKGFLIVPSEKKNMQAAVVATGSEVDKCIEIGDMVQLLHDTGIPVTVDGESYLSIVENQVVVAWKS